MDTVYFLSLVYSRCDREERVKYFKIARKNVLPHVKGANERQEATLRYKIASLCIYLGYYPYKVLYELRKLQKKIIQRNMG